MTFRRAGEMLLAIVLLLLAAMVLCGLFGALHDQISFTVSPEYYTRFKFVMFGHLPFGPDRLSVANVGFLATWWMGVPIGATLGTIGLFAPDARTMLRETLRAFVLVAIVALAFSLGGLLAGIATFRGPSPVFPPDWYLPAGPPLRDPAAFLRAGSMHNAAYLGGAIGTLIAAIRLAGRVSALRRSARGGTR